MQHSTQSKLDEKQWDTLGPTVALTCLSTLVVLARLITRSRIVRSVGLDDWVICVSVVISWAFCGLTVGIMEQGIGGYVWTTQLDLTPKNAKTVLAWNCVYMALLDVTKASILLHYLRIFPSRAMRISTYCLFVTLVPALLWGILGSVLLCRPVSKLWNPRQEGSCMSLRRYWLSTAGVNIVLDFATVLLPLPSIWRLRLPSRQKFGLVLVFVLGFFVCGVSLTRVALVHLANVRHDWTEASIDAFTWSTVEANTGIICASLVALKPLVVRMFPNLLGGEPGIAKHSITLPVIKDEESVGGGGGNSDGGGGRRNGWGGQGGGTVIRKAEARHDSSVVTGGVLAKRSVSEQGDWATSPDDVECREWDPDVRVPGVLPDLDHY